MARKKTLQTELKPIESANSHAKVAELIKKGEDFIVQAAAFGSSYLSEASSGGVGPLYNRSIDYNSSNLSYLKYNNLINDCVAYQENNGFWNIRDYVVLCQTAWKRVPVFYQTIEIMTTLANTPIKWFGGSDDGKKFAKVWWEKIGGANLTGQSFRELTRSSNLILRRLDGGIKSNKINKFILGEEKKKNSKESEAARTIKIPVKYEVLNPAEICVLNSCGISYRPAYYQMIDRATKERLKKLSENPDAKIELSEELKKLINCDLSGPSLEPLDSDQIHTIFYRKQDYEPFALPMGFSVLEDINLKLEFKKCDAAVAKTIESMILLVTHGNEPDKGGMNPLVDAALKTVFKTGQPGGRIVVSDYTTKMEFIIPDLKKVIGPEKYQKLDQDINDGLMNIFFGDQKFANIMVKLRVFVAILVDLQNIFLNEFLIPEIKRVGKLVGYSEDEIPLPKFARINLDDPANINRIWANLAQIGVLTSDETVEAIESGILPTPEDSLKSQEQYKKNRKNDLYVPLIGAQKDDPAATGGRPSGTKKPKKTSSKPGWKGAASINEQFDILKFRENILLANDIANSLESEYKNLNNISKLTKNHKFEIKTILTHLTINEPPEKWKESVANYVAKQFSEPNLENVGQVEEIKINYEVDDYTGGLLLWSR